jgi:hypothetical protein
MRNFRLPGMPCGARPQDDGSAFSSKCPRPCIASSACPTTPNGASGAAGKVSSPGLRSAPKGPGDAGHGSYLGDGAAVHDERLAQIAERNAAIDAEQVEMHFPHLMEDGGKPKSAAPQSELDKEVAAAAEAYLRSKS